MTLALKEAISMANCCICSAQLSKYKCPACSILFCSVKCFQSHKSSNLCEAKTHNQSFDSPLSQPTECMQYEPLPPYQFPTKHTVPQNKLALLGKSANIRSLLCNPHLRTLLTALTRTSNVHYAMNMVMLEPIFVEFAMECLKTVEGEEKEEEETVEMAQFVKQIKQLVEHVER